MPEHGHDFVQLTRGATSARGDAAPANANSTTPTGAIGKDAAASNGGANDSHAFTISSIAASSYIKRRDALKAIAATAALGSLANACVAPDSAPSVSNTSLASGGEGSFAAGKGARGTPSDPFLKHPKLLWEKLLMPAELTTLAALCDTIIPADEKSPAASKVGAPDYINEYVSSPGRDAVLVQVRGGIIWLNGESMTRFGKPFHQLTDAQRVNVCDDICFIPKAKPGYVAAATFFNRVRNLTAGAFYTTPEGWKDIGYIGNVSMPEFKGPPVELLQRLGLA